MYVRTYGKNDLTEVINLFNDTVKTVNWDEFNDEQKKVALFKSPEPIHDFLNSNITLVLKDDNKIRGFVMMTKKGYIKFLYVDKNHLKKGYGKKLLKRIEEKAKELGLKEIHLHASKFASKNKIYEKLGYKNKGKEVYVILGVDFIGDRMEKKKLNNS